MSTIPYDKGASTGGIPGTGDTSSYPYGAVAYTDGSGNGSIVTAANGLPVTALSTGYTSQPTVTRPANTTPYTAGDVIGGVITFASAGPSAGHVVIMTTDLWIAIAAVPAGMANLRLYLYDTSPPSALADNAPWDLPSGDRASYLGYIDYGTPVDVGSTLIAQVPSPGIKVKLAAASTSLYGYLVTTGGFTPAGNSEVYTPRLNAVGV